MKISRSSGYALLAASYIARNQKKGIILSQDIAKKYKISQPKQIGNALANIADSMRTVRSEYLNLKLKHI